MRFWSTVLFLLILLGLALRYGRGPERAVALLLGANLFLSILNRMMWTPDFANMSVALAIIDALTLVGVTLVAVRANRVWPLGVASLQLVVMIAHASVYVSIGWSQVYYGMMALAQYLELIILASGVASHRIREKRIGRYREWRCGYEPTVVRFAILHRPRRARTITTRRSTLPGDDKPHRSKAQAA